MTEEDFRTELLVWILIDAFSDFPGYVDQKNFDDVMARYEKALKEKGVEIKWYPNIVTGHYDEGWQACVRAMEYQILGTQRPGSTRALITGSVRPFLRKTNLLTTEEIKAAQEAAQTAAQG